MSTNQTLTITDAQNDAIKAFQSAMSPMHAMETLNDMFRSFITDASRIEYSDQGELNKENSNASLVIERIVVLLSALESK